MSSKFVRSLENKPTDDAKPGMKKLELSLMEVITRRNTEF